jgi:hypothetical protein
MTGRIGPSLSIRYCRLPASGEVRDGTLSGICYTEASVTEVFFTEAFETWWHGLTIGEQEDVAFVVRLLEARRKRNEGATLA